MTQQRWKFEKLRLNCTGRGQVSLALPSLHFLYECWACVLCMGTTLLISIGNVNKRQHLKIVIQIWRNLAEILFKSHLVKESIKLKVGKRSQRQPGLDAFSTRSKRRSKLDSTMSCDVTEFPVFARTTGQERTPGLNLRDNQVHESY